MKNHVYKVCIMDLDRPTLEGNHQTHLFRFEFDNTEDMNCFVNCALHTCRHDDIMVTITLEKKEEN